MASRFLNLGGRLRFRVCGSWSGGSGASSGGFRICFHHATMRRHSPVDFFVRVSRCRELIGDRANLFPGSTLCFDSRRLAIPPIQTTPSCCLLACILFYIHALQELITNLTPPLRPNLSNSLLSPLELPPPQPPSSKILQHEHYSSTPRPQLQKHQPEPLEGSVCRTWRDCSSIRATPPATSCLG